MNLRFTHLPPEVDAIDVVIPTCRAAEFSIKLLQEAAEKAAIWQKHRFIFVFDHPAEEAEETFRDWVRDHEHLPLPRVSTHTISPELSGNLAAIRQKGFDMGDSPFIYFQDDDDPLPCGIERRLKLMLTQPWEAVYGATETITTRGQLIERFPTMRHEHMFLYDVVEGTRWFPTYLHPLSALFRRSMIERFKYDDGTPYRIFENAAFVTRMLHGGARVVALADVMRRAVQHGDNLSDPIFSGAERADLVADIRQWQEFISDHRVRSFQEHVADLIEEGTISTFKEIDVLIEEKLDSLG